MKVLVPLDFSNATGAVVDYAERSLAHANATVWLMHVVTPSPSVVAFPVAAAYMPPSREELDEYRRKLQPIAARLRRTGAEVHIVVCDGIASQCILDQARQCEADCIILGSHGHGALHHLLMGSVCESLMKRAICPITIVPARVPAAEEEAEAEPAATDETRG